MNTVLLYTYYAFFVTEEKLEDVDSHWSSTVLSSLLEDPSTHDVTFKTSDGGSVSAHRVIVAAGSPVFHAMLYGNMQESSQKEIELPNIDSGMLKGLLDFLYAGRVQADSLTKCLLLLQVADYFDIDSMKTICIHLVEKELCFDNYCEVATFAVQHGLETLLVACLHFMEPCAEFIVSLGIYADLGFNSEPLPLIVAFLKSSNLEVREVDLFLAAVEWCKRQKQKPTINETESIFKNIRYPLISKTDLLERVKTTNMANNNLCEAALDYHTTGTYDGPKEQLVLRQYVFDFCCEDDSLTIEHTTRGTLIRKSNQPRKSIPCATKVSVEEGAPVTFIFCLNSCTRKQKMKIGLMNDIDILHEEDLCRIPLGKEVEGIISAVDQSVQFQLGDVIKFSLPLCDGQWFFYIVFCSVRDEIVILRT